MQVVFDTKPLAAAVRRQAWRDAICEIYLQVDCAAEQDSEYAGFVREARFGEVTLTDTLLSPQSIRRQSRHLAHAGKDCYYAGIEQLGNLTICQAGSSFLLRPGVGTVYYANEPYELHCSVMSRQFWIELPRHAFDSRFDSGRPPLFANLDLSRGLGRIALEFCTVLAAEGAHVDPQSKAKLGEEFMDILALALTGEPGRQPVHETKRPKGAAPVGQGLHRRAFERT